jgi:hypothetical protein
MASAALREAQRLLALRRMGIWLRDQGLAPADDRELLRLAGEAVSIVENARQDAVVWSGR